ncbi:MAG TPA: response regulator [Polyangia bacterium]|jgi:two-component system response regulator MprA|nr:response regulator [Polyangia bacterium]HWE29240.1 response regulator [Polyangia bacterium]
MTNSACVLVIDDDVDIRDSIGDILELRGYRVARAANGREALERLKSGPPPCVILLDLMMPVLNGWEFREQQSRDARLAGVPVVVISGDGSTDEKAAKIGVSEFLRKPLELSAILDVVRRHCSGNDHPR